ncbi:MAG: hypothetical protein JSS81_05595 [Acidobacteria bacterium]|nr:hypothetical protein [Acidobacteriota bacterium]
MSKHYSRQKGLFKNHFQGWAAHWQTRLLSVWGLLFLLFWGGASVSAQTTVVVNQTSAQGWVFYNDETDKIDPTLGKFVTGPGTAPLGTGGVQISVSGTQRRNLATYQFSGTPLANITTLKFSTYNPSAGNGGSADRSGYLNFNVDFNGSDTWQRRLIYVPSQNGTVVQNTWQEWDAINGGAALWSYSGPAWPIGVGGGGEPGTTLKTWSQVLSQYPGVRIRVTDSFLGIRVGEPYADGYTENIDAFKFGTGAGTTFFDFEPAAALTLTPNASPTALDNDYTRINNAVQAVAAGGTITLNGTFDWTEPNAAASWALGSDGQTGGSFGDDDYCILAPANLNGVTVTAASLGAATIQGPGDLAGANLEGVFQFYSGGTNQNWTISNLRFLDFDNAIGFYFNGGPTTVYNNTHIVNNYIRVARDLNATVAPADVNQNIGIHYAFGTNQLISGNTIELAGDGTSDAGAGNYSTEVGMQSNTSGGAVYDGLQITNNTIRVLNAQNNANPETILGIWENAHAHSSNITVSGNQFLNQAGGNNPAVNLQRGFRVTSHSSVSTTVIYANNTVEGANIGFQWIAGSNFAGNQPVRLTSNVIRNGGTGVLVQSNGLANLKYNRIVGNGAAGVQNETGSTTDAENNWWGCNYGPGAGGAGCSGTANGVTGSGAGAVDANPWLTLTTAASPNAIATGGNSTVTSKLTINSASADTSGSGSVPNGTPASFAGTLGTVAPPTGVTAAGVTGTTFTAGVAAGAGSASTTVDGQTVSAPIAITFSCNNVSIPTNIQTLRNNQVTVPINVDDLTGRGIIAFDYRVNYNASVMTYLGFAQTGTLSNGMTITINSLTPGTLIVSGFSATPMAGSGTLINLNFFATGAIGTSSPVSFASFAFNEGVPCVATSNGSVSIVSAGISGAVTYANAPTLTPVPYTTLSGAGSVPVSTQTDLSGNYSLTGFGSGAYTVTPSKTGDVNGITSFDSARIAQHVVSLITLNATQLLAADVSGNNTVTSFDAALIAQYIVLIPNPGSTGTWKFIPASRSYPNVETGAGGQDYSAILMGEVSGNWTPPTMFGPFTKGAESKTGDSFAGPVGVTAQNTTAAPSFNFALPIVAQDTTGTGIISYQFDFVYDPTKITPLAAPCDVSGTLSSAMFPVCNTTSPGLLKVAVFGSTPTTGAGTLIKLQFTAIGPNNTTSPATLQNFLFNEGDPSNTVTNGTVTILTPTAANVEVGGMLLTAGGEPVRNGTVTLTGENGFEQSVRSNSFGYFRFTDVPSGANYVIAARARGLVFNPQTIAVNDPIAGFNLIAEP